MIYGELVQRWRLAQGAVLAKWPHKSGWCLCSLAWPRAHHHLSLRDPLQEPQHTDIPFCAVAGWGPWFLWGLFAAILVWEEVWDLPNTAYLSAWLLIIITVGASLCRLREQSSWRQLSCHPHTGGVWLLDEGGPDACVVLPCRSNGVLVRL